MTYVYVCVRARAFALVSWNCCPDCALVSCRLLFTAARGGRVASGRPINSQAVRVHVAASDADGALPFLAAQVQSQGSRAARGHTASSGWCAS